MKTNGNEANLFERFVNIIRETGIDYRIVGSSHGPHLKCVKLIDHSGDKSIFIFDSDGELSMTQYYEGKTTVVIINQDAVTPFDKFVNIVNEARIVYTAVSGPYFQWIDIIGHDGIKLRLVFTYDGDLSRTHHYSLPTEGTND